ncbi:MAG: hypothetical protein ACRCXM_02155 [Beijerinckiaceae bacterium]
MAEMVGLVQSSAGDIAVRIPALDIGMPIKRQMNLKALQGFAEGCQNFLPAMDEEVIWDWHQGLDTLDGKPTVTLVAQPIANDTRENAQRLTIECRENKVRILIGGFYPYPAPHTAIIAAGTSEAPFRTEPAAAAHALYIADRETRRFLDLLAATDSITLATADQANRDVAMAIPIAGFHLAARRLQQVCPANIPTP